MKILKNNKAITLIALVITIIILIILASVATYSGIQIVNSSKLAAFTTELKIMQTQVNALYDLNSRGEKKTINGEKKEINKIGKDISTVQTQAKKVFAAIEREIDSQEEYRYYDQETIKDLGIEGVEGEFFVNVSKRSVVSYDGLKYNGEIYYTLKQLPDSLYNVEYNNDTTSGDITFELNVDILKKGEWNVSVSNISYEGNINNWNVEYKLSNKEQYNNSSDKLSFKIYEEGTYDFKIKNGDFESEEIKNVILYTPDNNYIKNHPEDYYGHYVTNYNSQNDAGINAQDGEKWQIFMADDDNIYLIASNFITRQYTGTKNSVGFDYDTENYTEATATKMWFTSIKDQYNANSTTTDIPGILSKLDKQSTYHKWMNTESNQTSDYNNEKAVASMLDVDVWSGYKNTAYAKYAIGGPTIEMFCKGYNDSHTGDELEAKETNTDNTYGYRIKKGTADPANSVSELKTGAKNTLVDNMYFKSSTEGNSYWLASPSANAKGFVMYAYSNGVVSYHTNTYNHFGFCPLVCLKSDVLLAQNEDEETYSIVL